MVDRTLNVELAPRVLPGRLALARLLALPVRWTLGFMVVASASARWIAGRGHVTPTYLGDEYIYPTLAHGLATTGLPTIRGEIANFPALLEPLLAAPLWLTGDPLLTYRLTQGLHALAISLAAVPAFLLARRLGLGSGFGLAVAAFTLVAPTLVYSSHMLADPVAYPLALGALYAGVRALERPTGRAQLAFLGLSALATAARIQYAFLPLAFLGAAAIVERASLRQVATRFRLTLGLMALGLLVGAATGPARLAGTYWHIPTEALGTLALARWTSAEAMVLAYGVGWALVPAALVGIAFSLFRPRTRAERSFAALTVIVVPLLLLEGAMIAVIDSERVQERYLMLAAPLMALAFGLQLRRSGRRGQYAVALLALALLAVSARVPLSGYTVGHGKDDSPTLWAVQSLERILTTADASLVVAVLAAGLSIVAATAAFRAGAATACLALSAVVGLALSVGAHAQDARVAGQIREQLPTDLRWVDHSGLGSVSLLQTPGAGRNEALEHLFWNRSVDEVLLLGDARPTDGFASQHVEIAGDGRLLVDGVALRRPLLVQSAAAQARFAGARLVERAPGFELWRPVGVPRLRELVLGRFQDGWLARAGSVTLWPGDDGRTRGTLQLVLSLPPQGRAVVLRLKSDGRSRSVRIGPGEQRVLRFPIDRASSWTLRFDAARPTFLPDLRSASVRAEPPVFIRSPASARG